MRDGCHPADGEVAAVIHPRSDVAYVAVGVRDEFNASNDPGGSILAIGPDGKVIEGWPVALGDRVHARRLLFSLDGPLIVEAIRCATTGCGSGEEPDETVWIAIEPDGTVHPEGD